MNIQTARILVVDDAEDMCTLCAMALRREHHSVETTSNPEAALRLLSTEAFDLLLTDISMPTMSGLELAQQAQALQPLLDVVIMTGQPSYDVLEDALQHGVADFLPKPFELDQLRLTITRTLARQHLRRENLRLAPLSHVVDASHAFAASLDQTTIAKALVAAVRRETGLECVHVQLTSGEIFPSVGSHSDCVYWSDGAHMAGLLRLPLRAHDATIGNLLLAMPDDLSRQYAQSEVLQLLAKHGALALHNAEMYATLSDLDHQKSEFIALASHELRTPLSVVLGYSTMLQHKLPGPQAKHMNEIVRAALRLNDLVDDLINLRQLQQHEAQLDFAHLELQTVLRTLNHRLEPLATARQIELRVQAPRRPILFTGDRDRLTLALGHLIMNGIRFTPADGRVVVTAGQQPPERGGNLIIAVDDTGIGIDSYELHRVFKRFYQVADSRTRQEGGLGIGLSLARMLIELHGGSLDVRSVPGRGSRFIVTLPGSRIVPQDQT